MHTLIASILLFAFIIPFPVAAQLSATDRTRLEAELRALEREIAEKQAELTRQRQQTGTIQRDVNVLASQIAAAQARVRQKNLEISKLSSEINQRQSTIGTLESKLDAHRDSLALLLRKSNQVDDQSMIHILLATASVSDFYRDIDDYASVKASINKTIDSVTEIKNLTQEEKEKLEKVKNSEVDARVVIEAQKRKVEQSEAEKKRLLALSRQKESEYQREVQAREARKKQILDALFSLRDSGPIPFGKALEYATAASEKTGVRPALILAILTQESNLGRNVGTCNRAGDPASKSYRNIMPGPAERASGRSSRDDQTAFLRITRELGLNPETTPLSCPSGGGWGGAMGPSQFIPTTWLSIRGRVATALGKSLANPWNPEDAIMATALYMADRGAAAGGYTAERNAACRYYSGSACQNGRRPPNVFYGNAVMNLAKNIQENMIDPLQNL